MVKVRCAGVSSGEMTGTSRSVLFSCPFAGTNRIRFKGLDELNPSSQPCMVKAPLGTGLSLADEGGRVHFLSRFFHIRPQD